MLVMLSAAAPVLVMVMFCTDVVALIAVEVKVSEAVERASVG
jgi:hypothetical protein